MTHSDTVSTRSPHSLENTREREKFLPDPFTNSLIRHFPDNPEISRQFLTVSVYFCLIDALPFARCLLTAPTNSYGEAISDRIGADRKSWSSVHLKAANLIARKV